MTDEFAGLENLNEAEAKEKFVRLFNEAFLFAVQARRGKLYRQAKFNDGDYEEQLAETTRTLRPSAIHAYRDRDLARVPEAPILEILVKKLAQDEGLNRTQGEILLRCAVSAGKLTSTRAKEIFEQTWPELDPTNVRDNLAEYHRTHRTLFGRDDQSRFLLDRLQRRGGNPIIVNGYGGVGKTAFVMDVVGRCLRSSMLRRPEPNVPVFKNFIFCTAKRWEFQKGTRVSRPPEYYQSNSRAMLRKIAEVLNRRDLTFNSLESIRDWLDGNLCDPSLIIIDDFESIEDLENPTDPSPQTQKDVMGLIQILPATCHVIVTTRLCDRMADISLGALENGDAKKLALDWAGHCKVSITDEDAERIAKQCYGVPLGIVTAIEMCAYNPKLSLDAVLAALNLERPNSGSYAQFCFGKEMEEIGKDEAEHSIFMAASMFDEPVDQRTVFQIAGYGQAYGIAEEALVRLAHFSFVHLGGEQLSLPASVRAFARSERVKDQDFRRSTRQNFNSWCIDLIRTYGREDWHRTADNYHELQRNWPHLQSFFRWCQRPQDEPAQEKEASVSRRKYKLMKEAWRGRLGSPDSYTTIDSKWEDRDRCTKWLFRRAIERREWSVAVESMANHAYALVLLGDPKSMHDAREIMLDHALPICGTSEERGVKPVEPRVRALLHQIIGLYRWRNEEQELALAEYKRADDLLAEDRKMSRKDRIAYRINSNYYRTMVYMSQGYTDQVARLIKDVMNDAEDIGWDRAITYINVCQARLFMREHNYEAAKTLLARCREESGSRSDDRSLAHISRSFGELYYSQEDKVQDAIAWLERSLGIYSNIGMRREEREVEEMISRLRGGASSAPVTPPP